MNDQSWQLIEHIFNVAIELPANQRKAYLDSACLDHSVRAEVESLIEAEEKSKTFFENQIAAAAREAVTEREKSKQAQKEERIGDYRLVRLVGVDLYLAEAPDGARVMLRVLPGGPRNPAGDRVAAERRFLEKLRHSNIARVLDGGETSSRRPFVVTETVEGERLEEHCDSRGLTLAERLALFQQVCRAVHYGHRRLRLHGRLEPSNVVVLPDGTLKLADFGLARLQALAEDRLIPRHSAETASPEELRGEEPTAASETYSLGVILFRLLAGRPPYDLRSSSTLEIERIVCELPVPRPSALAHAEPGAEGIAKQRGLSPEDLQRRLRGDLDKIVLRAMAKDPNDRYESAAHLAEDLTAYLEGRPVRARGLGWPYSLGKLLRRHWRLASAVSLLLAGLVVFSFWSGLRLRRLSSDLAAGAAAGRESALVSGFLIDLYGVADPREGRENAVTAREILDWGAARVAREMAGRPIDQAILLAALGEAYARLGLYAQAHDVAADALAKRRQAFGERHTATAATLNLLGRIETLRGRYLEAQDFYRKALEIDRAVAAGDAALARDLTGFAASLHGAESTDQAEKFARSAVDLLRGRPSATDPLALAESLQTLAAILTVRGQYDEAESCLREALELVRTNRGALHPETAVVLGSIGELLRDSGRIDQAEDSLGKALSATLEIYGERHPAAADSLRRLAQVLSEKGRPNEAREMLRVALDIDRSALGPQNLAVAADLDALGKLAKATRDTVAAEQYLRQALEIRTARLDRDHPLRAESLLSLGSLLGEGEQAPEAQGMLEEASRIFAKTEPDGNAHMAEATTALARCLAYQGSYEEAERLLATGPAAEGANPMQRRSALQALEQVYRAWGRDEDADRTAKMLAALP